MNADERMSPGSSLSGLMLQLVRPYHRWLAIVLVAMLFETAASIAAPWPLKIIIDNVIGGRPLPPFLAWLRDVSFGNHTVALALTAALSVVAIAVVGAVADFVDSYYTESVGQYVANDLRHRLYSHLHRLSLRYHETHPIGNLLSTIVADVGTIQTFASTAVLSIIVDALTIAGMVGVMLYLDFDFALVAVAATPVLLLFIVRFKRAIKHATRIVRLRQSDIVGVLQHGLQSVRTVEAFGRQDTEVQRLDRAGYAAVKAALRARRVKAMLSPIIDVTVALCVAFVLWRGASLIARDAMTVGSLAVFFAYLNKFFKPVKDLASMTNVVAQATVAMERVQAILDADTVIPQRPNARVPGRLAGDIVFSHVAFAYEPSSPVLHEIDLHIAPGQHVGIYGPTGGGKSTVLSLIPRFYDVTSGQVRIDGVDVADYNLDLLRAQIGFVLQDTVLFAGSVRENIAYGKLEATFAEIVAAARMANAHEFIAQMPNGYDATIGERGMTLSGGQRQRIGVARAILRNSPILLLDEPTASLDAEAETLVTEALTRLMEGRTVITATHRLSTIRHADHIFVIDGGRVVEDGTHDRLMSLNALYAELYRLHSDARLPTVARRLSPQSERSWSHLPQG